MMIVIERVKDLIYFFISEKRKALIKANQKKWSDSKKMPDYQLGWKKETVQFTRWKSSFQRRQWSIRVLKACFPKSEVDKILEEFNQLGNLIIKSGKISLKKFLDSRNYDSSKNSNTEGNITFDQLIASIRNNDFHGVHNESYARILYEELTGLEEYERINEFHLKHTMYEFATSDKGNEMIDYFTKSLDFSNLFNGLKSLLFIATFKEENSRPCLIKIIDNQKNNENKIDS